MGAHRIDVSLLMNHSKKGINNEIVKQQKQTN